MPRQFDQFLQNAQLTNNPNNTISAGALANLIQPPPNLAQLLEQILIDAINKLLQQIDDVTGLDLLAFAEELEGLFGPGGLLTKLLAFIQTISGSGLIQALIDAIANALGLSGINHLVSEIKTLLENIPFANILSALGLANIGEDVQAIIDHIIQALGGTGTGHILSDLITFLEAIPNGNILSVFGLSDIGADVQAIVDKIVNALGHSGTGHTLANLLSFLGAIPSGNITAILGSTDLGADVQAIVDKLSNAFGHTGTGHTLANLLTYLDNTFGSSFPKVFPFVFGSSTSNTPAPLVALSQFQQLVDGIVNNGSVGNQVSSAVAALQSELQTARSDIAQAILDGIHSTNKNTGIAAALQALPFGNITSILGNTNLGADIQAIIDHIVNALGVGGVGHTLVDLLTYLAQIPAANITAILGSANLGADVQAIVDKLANAFGQVGTGHTLANLLAYAQAIPNANIAAILGSANLGADVQAIVDQLANAFGHSGTGHTLVNLLAYAEAIPHTVITNILGSSDLGADLQAVVDKLANAWGQSGTGHTLANLLSYAGAIPNTVIAAILGGASLGADVQAIVDNLSNAFGHSGTGHTLANLLAYAEAIPNTVITAVLGSANLGADLQAVLDKIANGLGQSGTGHTLANLLTYMGGLAPVLGSTTLGGDVQAIVDKLANAFGQAGTGHTLANLLAYAEAIPNVNITAILGGANLGADVQAIVDKIVNALGTSGTGHTLATLLSLLGAIPMGNVSGLLSGSLGSSFPKTFPFQFGTATSNVLANLVSGSQFQQLLDGIVNDGASGHTVAAAVAALQNQIDTAASGIVQAILDGINSVTNQNSGIASALGAIPGANIASITNVEQNVVDLIDQAVNGGESVGNAVSTVLSNIESHNVALPVVFDAVGAGNSVASLVSGTPLSWAHTIGTYGNVGLLVAVTFNVNGGIGAHARTCKWTQTGGSSQNLTSLGAINSGGATGATAGWVELFYILNPATNLSNSGSVSVSVNVTSGNTIGQSVSYGNVAGVTGITTGSSNTNATSFSGAGATTPVSSYAVAAICASQSITSITASPINPGTQRAGTNFGTASLASNLMVADVVGAPLGVSSFGVETFTAHSGVSASWGGVQVVLSPAHTHQTAYQAVVDGIVSNLTPGGTSIAGSDADLIGDVLSAIPALNVAGVGGPATIADTHQATWDAAVQAIMGVTTTGHSIADFFNALLHLKTSANAAYTASGAKNNVQIFNASGTYTVPAGMTTGNHFDIIVVGGGGGGAGGQYPDFGNGGAHGSWNAVTLTYGTSFTTGTTSFTVTVGAGGTAGAASGGTGGSGGTTSVAIAGYGSSPVTTSGGAGGSGVAFTGTGYQGASPGPETFNGTTYSGGAVQNTKSADGNSPGGGGAGGYSVLGQAGGAGAPGAVIIVAYT